MAGDQPFPLPLLERELARRLGRPDAGVRVIRAEGMRLLVRLRHTDVPAARIAWNEPPVPGGLAMRTIRSYGTLRKGKLWLRRRPPLRP